jgi:hypothetical protein
MITLTHACVCAQGQGHSPLIGVVHRQMRRCDDRSSRRFAHLGGLWTHLRFHWRAFPGGLPRDASDNSDASSNRRNHTSRTSAGTMPVTKGVRPATVACMIAVTKRLPVVHRFASAQQDRTFRVRVPSFEARDRTSRFQRRTLAQLRPPFLAGGRTHGGSAFPTRPFCPSGPHVIRHPERPSLTISRRSTRGVPGTTNRRGSSCKTFELQATR